MSFKPNQENQDAPTDTLFSDRKGVYQIKPDNGEYYKEYLFFFETPEAL